jgi:hypothetical protein
MFENLKKYYQLQKNNVFDVVPLTYTIDVDNTSSNCINSSLSEFTLIFNIFEKKKEIFDEIDKQEWEEFDEAIPDNDSTFHKKREEVLYIPPKAFSYPSKGGSSYTVPMIPMCHFAGQNFWILKAINLNRGRGIHVFNDLKELKKLVKKYSLGDNRNRKESSTEQIYSQPAQIEKEVKVPKIEMKSFIIQKYIEKPFLIHNRKFDIRIWVSVSSSGKCYFFKEGYLRTSASEFSMDSNKPDDPAVHLTNNAIQKNVQSYGQFEDGNQLSFSEFEKYLDLNHPGKYDFQGKELSADFLPVL